MQYLVEPVEQLLRQIPVDSGQPFKLVDVGHKALSIVRHHLVGQSVRRKLAVCVADSGCQRIIFPGPAELFLRQLGKGEIIRRACLFQPVGDLVRKHLPQQVPGIRVQVNGAGLRIVIAVFPIAMRVNNDINPQLFPQPVEDALCPAGDPNPALRVHHCLHIGVGGTQPRLFGIFRPGIGYTGIDTRFRLWYCGVRRKVLPTARFSNWFARQSPDQIG